MATIDEDLGQLEKDIRQLKIEYDQYFGGGRKRPPTEIEWRIDLLVKRYSERGGELKFAQRFRFNNLSQTYAKYKDIFRKRTAQKEEGKIQRHFGAAAKEIEAARVKKEEEEHAREPKAFRMTCSEPERESDKVASRRAHRKTLTVELQRIRAQENKGTPETEKLQRCRVRGGNRRRPG
jgi:hypothetical protein